MGKLSKLFLSLIFVIAIGFPCVTVKVNSIMQNQETDIKQLGTSLKDTEDKLQTSEEKTKNFETKLDAEKGKRETAEKNLKSARNQVISVKDELGKKENQLNTCAAEKKTLQNEMAKLQDQKSEVETKYSKQAEELASLKSAIITKKIGAESEQGEESISEHGKIVGITGKRYATISLGKDIGLKKKQEFFVYHKGKVLGKVSARGIYGATVVIENSDKDIMNRIIEGDLVRLDEEKLIPTGFLEGKATNVSPNGFIAIDADEKSKEKLNPTFAVYRDGNLLGKLDSERVVSLLIIADLIPISHKVKISENDFIRMPR